MIGRCPGWCDYRDRTGEHPARHRRHIGEVIAPGRTVVSVSVEAAEHPSERGGGPLLTPAWPVVEVLAADRRVTVVNLTDDQARFLGGALIHAAEWLAQR